MYSKIHDEDVLLVGLVQRGFQCLVGFILIPRKIKLEDVQVDMILYHDHQNPERWNIFPYYFVGLYF